MSLQRGTPQKYSNLLQTNPESIFSQLNIYPSISSNNGGLLGDRKKRRSFNLCDNKSKNCSQTISADLETLHSSVYDEKSKITRVLIDANFGKKSQIFRTKNKNKRKHYVIRRRNQKVGGGVGGDGTCQTRNQKQKQKQEQPAIDELQTSKTRELFKIKRKTPKFGIQEMVPKFGIEDIVPKFSNKRTNQMSRRSTTGLFMSTCYNTFFNCSFYINSKIKQLNYHNRHNSHHTSTHNSNHNHNNHKHSNSHHHQRDPQLRIDKRREKAELSPEVTNLRARRISYDDFIVKKKQIERMYTTNFGFARSKTEEIEANFVCGWENRMYEDMEEDIGY